MRYDKTKLRSLDREFREIDPSLPVGYLRYVKHEGIHTIVIHHKLNNTD